MFFPPKKSKKQPYLVQIETILWLILNCYRLQHLSYQVLDTLPIRGGTVFQKWDRLCCYFIVTVIKQK